jgi:hypothetical protein
MQPGQTSRHAVRISWLSSGWFRAKSTGLAAKHTITALTELLMMPNMTLDTTSPPTSPTLQSWPKEKHCESLSMTSARGCKWKTYANAVAMGSCKDEKDNVCVCSIRKAKQPVIPPSTRLAKSRTLGTRSSVTIVVHPRFSNKSVA